MTGIELRGDAMKPGWIAAWAITATALPGLAACGGSSPGGTSPPSASATGQAATGQAATGQAATGQAATGQAVGQPTASRRTGGQGSLTPPGTHLGFGREATVGWVPPSAASGSGAHKGLKLGVAVMSIQKGTMADFRNVDLDASERKATPYYVTVRITALGAIPPPADSDPAISVTAIDDRGQQQESVTFFGTFARCDDTAAPKPFVNGSSYRSCLAYLIPGGGSIQKVEWANGPSGAGQVTPYFDNPIIWGG